MMSTPGRWRRSEAGHNCWEEALTAHPLTFPFLNFKGQTVYGYQNVLRATVFTGFSRLRASWYQYQLPKALPGMFSICFHKRPTFYSILCTLGLLGRPVGTGTNGYQRVPTPLFLQGFASSSNLVPVPTSNSSSWHVFSLFS